MRKLLHYYHAYVAGEADVWKRIMVEHFTALESSGLLARLNVPVRIGLVGDPFERYDAWQWLDTHLPAFEVVAAERTGFEQVTLHQLWERTKVGTDAVLYAHTKGGAHPSPRQDQWRHELTQSLVHGWRQCVRHLDYSDVVGAYHIVNDGEAQGYAGDGANAVAAALNKELGITLPVDPVFPEVGEAIFAGNFFWAASDWILSLLAPLERSRYDAETWIGGANRYGRKPTVHNVQEWMMRQ